MQRQILAEGTFWGGGGSVNSRRRRLGEKKQFLLVFSQFGSFRLLLDPGVPSAQKPHRRRRARRIGHLVARNLLCRAPTAARTGSRLDAARPCAMPFSLGLGGERSGRGAPGGGRCVFFVVGGLRPGLEWERHHHDARTAGPGGLNIPAG